MERNALQKGSTGLMVDVVIILPTAHALQAQQRWFKEVKIKPNEPPCIFLTSGTI